jgi:hypothetical protein
VRCHAMGEAGRRFVRRFHWDTVAWQQERVYLEAVSARPGKLWFEPGSSTR